MLDAMVRPSKVKPPRVRIAETLSILASFAELLSAHPLLPVRPSTQAEGRRADWHSGCAHVRPTPISARGSDQPAATVPLPLAASTEVIDIDAAVDEDAPLNEGEFGQAALPDSNVSEPAKRKRK